MPIIYIDGRTINCDIVRFNLSVSQNPAPFSHTNHLGNEPVIRIMITDIIVLNETIFDPTFFLRSPFNLEYNGYLYYSQASNVQQNVTPGQVTTLGITADVHDVQPILPPLQPAQQEMQNLIKEMSETMSEEDLVHIQAVIKDRKQIKQIKEKNKQIEKESPDENERFENIIEIE